MNRITEEIINEAELKLVPFIDQLVKEGAARVDIERAVENYIHLKSKTNFKRIHSKMRTAGELAKEWLNGFQREKNDSSVELVLYDALTKNGIDFVFQRQIGKYRVDFLIKNTVVEVDGPQHLQQENRKRDAWRDSYLGKLGYTIIRIPANLVGSFPDECVAAIQRQIGGR